MKAYQTFKPGQKVRDRYGKTHTVIHQDGCRVWVDDECNVWYHPANLFPVTL